MSILANSEQNKHTRNSITWLAVQQKTVYKNWIHMLSGYALSKIQDFPGLF